MPVQIQPETEKNTQTSEGREKLKNSYKSVRSFTNQITEPLEVEDFVVQAMENTSPVKWHLAHTSWFFEAFVLRKGIPGYESHHPQYHYLFNSYYVLSGEPHCRDKRGDLSRPTVQDVFEYREYVDQKMQVFIDQISREEFDEWKQVISIGLNHEQQHQELILTDLKYTFGGNPLYPQYTERTRPSLGNTPELKWISIDEGVYEVGHPGGDFGYDNEFPRHKTYVQNFNLASRLVTNAEYLEFITDNGYKNTEWWLDEGAARVKEEGWEAPLYWIRREGDWYYFTLNGIEKLEMNEPVCHISYYEADAYARWAGCRLPTEQEWEIAADNVSLHGNFAEKGFFHPGSVQSDRDELQQMFGDVWQWTQSAYSPYPGFKPFPGALGEYNGKFMCNQYVLRGGSCATPKDHFRKTYRNFFHADARWQFSGIRLAQDA